MNKKSLMKTALIVLPLLVVFVASGPSAVIVFDGQDTSYYSWYQMVSGSSVGWCAPAAAMLNYISFALAVIYCLRKKEWSIKSVFVVSMAAACFAALPVVVQSDVKVVPNVMGMIFLGAHAMVAYMERKAIEAEEAKKLKGKKLKKAGK